MIDKYYGVGIEDIKSMKTTWENWKRLYIWNSKPRNTEAEINEFYEKMPQEYVASIELTAIEDKDKYLASVGDVKGLRVLDFGCGTGVYGMELLKKGAIVDFYDLKTPAIEFLKWKLKESNLEGNIIHSMNDLSKEYDIIINIDMLEHIKKPFNTIKHLFNILIKGGKLIIATPLIENLINESPKYKMSDIADGEHIEEAVKDWVKHKANDWMAKKFIIKGNLMVKPFYNVLMLYNYHPHTTGRYLETGLREYCKVINSNQAKIKPNGEGIKNIVKNMNIDFILQVDSGTHYRIPKGINCLKLNYNVDTFLKTELKMDFLKNYDLKLFAQSRFVKEKNDRWLPLAVDPNIYRRVNTDKKYDIGFCGTIIIDDLHYKRNELLKQITPDFNLYVGKDSNEWANLKYNQSYFVFNCAVADFDLNMRVFEVMGTGGVLLMNEGVDNMDELFTDGVHYIKYKDYADLKAKVLEIYRDEEGHIKMCNIVNNANKEVLSKHTYKHRAKQIIDWVEEII